MTFKDLISNLTQKQLLSSLLYRNKEGLWSLKTKANENQK